MNKMKPVFLLNILFTSAILLAISEILPRKTNISEQSIYSAFTESRQFKLDDKGICDSAQYALDNSCLKFFHNLRKETFLPLRDFRIQKGLLSENEQIKGALDTDWVENVILENLRLYYLSRACEGIERRFSDCQKIQKLSFNCKIRNVTIRDCWVMFNENLKQTLVEPHKATKRNLYLYSEIFPETLTEIYQLDYQDHKNEGHKTLFTFQLRAPKLSALHVSDTVRYLVAVTLTSILLAFVLFNKPSSRLPRKPAAQNVKQEKGLKGQ